MRFVLFLDGDVTCIMYDDDVTCIMHNHVTSHYDDDVTCFCR